MPQYELTFLDKKGKEHKCPKWGENPAAVESFVPLVVIDDDSDNPVCLDGTLIQIEEMEIFADFALDKETYFTVKKFAEEQGLTARKVTMPYRLRVAGKGEWIKSSWVNNFRIVDSNWLSSELTNYGHLFDRQL